jgi:putative tryptophan/tyrosine transport system substrate-binding protein
MHGVAKFLSLTLLIVGVATQAGGQEQRKLPRVGVLMSGSEASSRIQLDGLRKGLAAAGIAEGSGIVLDIKYADGNVDRLHPLAADLVKSRPDVLFAGGDQGSSAIKHAAAGQLPIVAVTCDALAAGLVTNLARPGENLTGVTCTRTLAGYSLLARTWRKCIASRRDTYSKSARAKRVEIMKDLTPSLSRLGVALNLSDKRMIAELRESERAGHVQSVAITPLDIVKPDDIESALAMAAEKQLGGVIFVFDAMTFFHRARVAKVAIQRGLRTAFNFRQYADAGGLFSFGPNLAEMYRQSARHILKVSKGEAPGEIPMEQPTHFELVINIKTAKALGLTVPPTLLARADEVIE